MPLQRLELVVSAGIALSAFLAALGLLRIPSLAPPTGGIRGWRRARLLRQGSLFLRVEPLVLMVGGWLSALLPALSSVLPSLRESLERLKRSHEQLLLTAGQPAGLDVHSFWALSLLSGFSVWSTALVFSLQAMGTSMVLPGLLIGIALPGLRISALRTERLTTMAREIPASIDLIALSMNAGSDFTGALRRVTAGQVGVVADELGLVLSAIDLGMTRATALRALQERIPVAEVRDLVRAVVLAEQKGASLADALSQLSVSSRQRRSVRAEEAAARAGVLLMGPMMLLVICVLILILGPMLAGGIGL